MKDWRSLVSLKKSLMEMTPKRVPSSFSTTRCLMPWSSIRRTALDGRSDLLTLTSFFVAAPSSWPVSGVPLATARTMSRSEMTACAFTGLTEVATTSRPIFSRANTSAAWRRVALGLMVTGCRFTSASTLNCRPPRECAFRWGRRK